MDGPPTPNGVVAVRRRGEQKEQEEKDDYRYCSNDASYESVHEQPEEKIRERRERNVGTVEEGVKLRRQKLPPREEEDRANKRTCGRRL